jgi:hypothetical protein
MMSRSIACGVAAALLTIACDSPPTAPRELARDTTPMFDVSFDPTATDLLVNGSEGQLSGFDGVSQLSYNTAKGSFIATFDNNTVFRAANVDRFAPVDPCRQFAINYNTAGATIDVNGLFLAISAMSTSGCLARIQVDKSVPPNPTAPIRSFRPLATF